VPAPRSGSCPLEAERLQAKVTELEASLDTARERAQAQVRNCPSPNSVSVGIVGEYPCAVTWRGSYKLLLCSFRCLHFIHSNPFTVYLFPL
jgi:hypothetical protein